jgi:hypothetical protein
MLELFNVDEIECTNGLHIQFQFRDTDIDEKQYIFLKDKLSRYNSYVEGKYKIKNPSLRFSDNPQFLLIIFETTIFARQTPAEFDNSKTKVYDKMEINFKQFYKNLKQTVS